MSRRRLIKRMLLGGGTVAAGVGVYARFIEPEWVTVTEVDLPVRGLGADLDGYRVAHISDLHVGRRVSTPYLERCMDRINDLAPDLIVVTGDLITGGLRDEVPTAGRILSRLHARDGLIASLGNHDYSGWVSGGIRHDIADRVAKTVVQTGGRTLRNETTMIHRGRAAFNLVGLDDLFLHRCKPELAWPGVKEGLPVIALSHNPDSMGILRHWPVNVVLSGHTHGGQVWLPFIGPPHLPITNRRYAAGLIHVDDKVLYVSRGLGNVMKVRFNCRPEITLHRLRQA